MAITLVLILLVAALILTILSAIDKAPLWVAMVFVIVALLIGRIPVG